MHGTWKYRTVEWGTSFVSFKWQDDELDGLTFEDGLNRLGSSGWELVTVFVNPSNAMTQAQTFVFKKPQD